MSDPRDQTIAELRCEITDWKNAASQHHMETANRITELQDTIDRQEDAVEASALREAELRESLLAMMSVIENGVIPTKELIEVAKQRAERGESQAK